MENLLLFLFTFTPKINRDNTMRNKEHFWVYIMSNKQRTTLYIGITNNLYRRYQEHKNEVIEGFTKKYRCHELIYFEEFTSNIEAIYREKQLKKWRREKKFTLIHSLNPEEKDLGLELSPIIY